MNDIEYEKFVGKVLRNLGAERSYRGFDYITYGTALVVKDGRKLYYITKSLYPEIAIKYKTTWRCVERDIRTIVDTIWKNGDKEFLRTERLLSDQYGLGGIVWIQRRGYLYQ